MSEKYCSCGFPQSKPIPHEHDRTEREKDIIKHYGKQISQLKAEKEAMIEKIEGIKSTLGITPLETIYEELEELKKEVEE